jgi:carboxyl-terminal processing protease
LPVATQAQQPYLASPLSQATTKPSRAGYLVASLLAAIALVLGFCLGNLASGLGVFDIIELLGSGGSGGVIGGSSGSTWGGSGNAAADATLDDFAGRIEEVCRHMEIDALHEFTPDEIDQATKTAIDGLLAASGDIRAEYFTQEEYELYVQDSSGEFVGIGVTLTTGLDGRVTISQVFNDSPAQEAGILPGDIIIAVDGVTQEWTVDEVVRAIRRPSGEQVEIVWERDGEPFTTSMYVRTIKREIVRYSIVEYEGVKVGYIFLDQFTYSCSDEVRGAIQDLEGLGAECYILDLRDNPGGLLYQSINIASMFIADGAIVHIDERGKTSVENRQGRFMTDKPLVVMVNGGSASASELVAAALQDHGRAVIVGEQSYGKGTVQDIHTLSFGGAVKYTIANYLSPDRRVIDGIGVTPDVIVDDGDRANDADIIHMLENGEEIDFEAEGIDIESYAMTPRPPSPGTPGYSYTPGDDLQLDAALQAVIDLF